MSDPLLPPPLLSASETPSSSTDSSSDSSDSSASLDSSTSSASVRLSPLPEADEDDVGEIGATGSRSPLHDFVETSVDAGHTQLMLDLRLLGFRCLEAVAIEADKIEGAAVEADRAVEDEANKVKGVAVEAEDDRIVEGEADNVVMRDEAENKGLTRWPWVTVAEGCQVGGIFIDERVEGFGLADGWQTRGGRAGRDKGDVADVTQTMGSGLEMRDKIKDGADERHIEERKRDETERGLMVAKSFRACTRVAVLAESLGLDNSSDSEGDEVDEGRFGAEGSLALMADERHLVEVEGSSVRVGECESEGLTEEVGVSRREALDPGMLDDVWPSEDTCFKWRRCSEYYLPYP